MTIAAPLELPIDYVEKGDGTMRAVYADQDKRVSVRFTKTRRPDVAKMLHTGKEEWIDEIILLKKARGSSNVPASRATEADKKRYRKEWDAFLRNETGKTGYGLADVYGIRHGDIEALASLDITTVQELIDADDSLLVDMPNGVELKQLATVFKSARDKEEEQKSAIILVETYKKKASELEAEVERLKAQVESKSSKKKGEIKQ